jgi:CMP-N-acetylneuraminic acid synthetase
MKYRITALVPMRHISERVPGKNYRLFNGKPLYHYVITELLGCPLIDRVVIDTDSPFILDDAQKHFENVQLIERPEHLRDGKIPMNEIILNDMDAVDADFYLQTHSTNPLVRSETFTHALELLLNSYPDHDSLFSVSRIQTRLWDVSGKPMNHNPAILMRTQDLTPVFEENSCIYIFSKDGMEKSHNRIGKKPLMFEMNPIEAWDIDEEFDFRIAEVFYKEREGLL